MIKLYETNTFYLRPFVESDITESYLQWFHDQAVTKYTSHGLFGYTKNQALQFLEKSRKNGDIVWAIMAKFIFLTQDHKESRNIINYDKGIHIGNISLQDIHWIDRRAEFAGVIGEKEYWGKGIGTEAVRLLFAHGFDKLNLNRIWLGTAASNRGMRTIAERLGMSIEGVLRKHLFLNGQYENVMQYGILRIEWNQK